MFTYLCHQTVFIIGTKIFYGPQQQAHVNIKEATRGDSMNFKFSNNITET